MKCRFHPWETACFCLEDLERVVEARLRGWAVLHVELEGDLRRVVCEAQRRGRST